MTDPNSSRSDTVKKEMPDRQSRRHLWILSHPYWAGIGVLVTVVLFVLSNRPPQESIFIEAASCTDLPNTSLNVAPSSDGSGIIMNDPPDSRRENGATYYFDVSEPGNYELWIHHAAKVSRPTQIWLNEKLIVSGGIADTTGEWGNPKPFFQELLILDRGENKLRLYRDSEFPHVRRIEFRPVDK